MPNQTFPNLKSVVLEARSGLPQPELNTPLLVDREIAIDFDWNSDIFNLQALLAYIESRGTAVEVNWTSEALSTFQKNSNNAAVLCALVLHSKVRNIAPVADLELQISQIRKRISRYRTSFDWFSPPQSIICADHLGMSRPPDLYEEHRPGIRSRDDFENLIFPFIERLYAVEYSEKSAFKWRAAFASVVYELFENTDLHGKSSITNTPLKNSIRGIIFRENALENYQKQRSEAYSNRKCIEIGIFDSGIGYFESSTKTPITQNTPIQNEWENLHKCLSAHLQDSPTPNNKGLHGIGLYEVLRALKFLKGAIEIRTGRVHAYRTFLEGDLQLEMEKPDSKDRPNMPKPTLLDRTREFLRRPTEHYKTIGSAIKVIVPIE